MKSYEQYFQEHGCIIALSKLYIMRYTWALNKALERRVKKGNEKKGENVVETVPLHLG